SRYHNVLSAGAEQDASRGGYLPRVDVQVYGGNERRETPGSASTSYSRPGAQLQLRQMIFDGFATQSDVKRLGYAHAARYYELLGASDDTALEAARGYLDVQRYRQLNTLAKDNWAMHKEILDQIERRVVAGVGRRVDLEQATGRTALAQSNWLTETSNLHDVTQRFQRVVGTTPPDAMAEPTPVTSKLPAERDLLATASNNNPSFLAAIASIRSARADVDVRRSTNYPNVSLQAETGTDRNLLGVSGDTKVTTIQAVVNWNLYKGGSDQARTRQSQEQVWAATDLRDKVCRDIRQQTSIAWNDVKKLREQLAYLEQHELSTAKSRDAYRQQYDIGQRTLLDLLNTENELFEARRASTNARYDLALAEYRVLAQTHNILPALNLAPLMTTSPDSAASGAKDEDSTVMCSTELLQVAPMDLASAVARPLVEPGEIAPTPASAPAPVAAAAALNPPVEPVIKAWAAAWSSKDLAGYKSFYSASFQPQEMSAKAWMANRAKRVTKKGPISVDLGPIAVKPVGKDGAEAVFEQRYSSADFKDVSTKTLTLKLEGGEWKIVRESSR
ncbi:MAG: TolC family outer membrane protein, partial [Zoogloea sp.]|nr:TolC family outer membrane protein [Zoogloea sp.]